MALRKGVYVTSLRVGGVSCPNMFDSSVSVYEVIWIRSLEMLSERTLTTELIGYGNRCLNNATDTCSS